MLLLQHVGSSCKGTLTSKTCVNNSEPSNTCNSSDVCDRSDWLKNRFLNYSQAQCCRNPQRLVVSCKWAVLWAGQTSPVQRWAECAGSVYKNIEFTQCSITTNPLTTNWSDCQLYWELFFFFWGGLHILREFICVEYSISSLIYSLPQSPKSQSPIQLRGHLWSLNIVSKAAIMCDCVFGCAHMPKKAQWTVKCMCMYVWFVVFPSFSAWANVNKCAFFLFVCCFLTLQTHSVVLQFHRFHRCNRTFHSCPLERSLHLLLSVNKCCDSFKNEILRRSDWQSCTCLCEQTHAENTEPVQRAELV